MTETSFHIKEPGLNVLPPGVERYTVNGGGITGIQIFPDDEIEIVNDEGNQICEISVFNKDGKSNTGILNLKENKSDNYNNYDTDYYRHVLVFHIFPLS